MTEAASWADREALAEALQALHLIDLNNLHEVVTAVVAAGWRPPEKHECICYGYGIDPRCRAHEDEEQTND